MMRVPRLHSGRRRALLFTFDALLASLLLLAALLLALHYTPSPLPIEQTSHYAQDAVRAASAIRVGDITNMTIIELIENSSVYDPTLSVLEQIGVFWATGDTARAENLSHVLLDDLLPADLGYSFAIGGTTLASRNLTDVSQRAVGRRMIAGIKAGQALHGNTSSAYLRKVRSKETRRYATFGGFVGQGDITVRLDDLPSDIDVESVREMFLEGEFDNEFELLINNQLCGTFPAASGDLDVQRFDVTNCSSLLSPGDNIVMLAFTGSTIDASVSGGLLGVHYNTSDLESVPSYGEDTVYLPAIDGVVNLYDGFAVPGSLKRMNATIHYWVADNVTLPLFFDIGNVTVLTMNVTGEQTYMLDDSFLDALLDYVSLSNTTVPLRIGFYEGNLSNSSGNLTDVILTTSLHGAMDTNDVLVSPGIYRTRLQQALNVSDLFVDIILNATGNRVGLVTYWSTTNPANNLALTTNAATLHTTIDAYTTKTSTDAERWLCGAMQDAKAALTNTSRKRAVMLMTDGDLVKSNGKSKCCYSTGVCTGEKAWSDAVREACNPTANPYNITFYAVAFGQAAVSNPSIVANMTRIAECTGGEFASGTNASELEEIYRVFAEDLAQSSVTYTYQRATTATNVNSRLYGDSAISLNYTPVISDLQQNMIPVVFQTAQFGSCTPTVTIPASVTVTESSLVSYSGDLWTKRLVIDGTTVYNLSRYGTIYMKLGDPYRLLLPPHLLTPGNHSFSIVLGANSSDQHDCSLNDSLIYTGLIPATTGRSIVLPKTEGCRWSVEYSDHTIEELNIPSNYNGTKTCSYTRASVRYDPEDAYDAAVFALFEQLDVERNHVLFFKFDDHDLEVIVTLVQQVPYLWGPTIVTLEVTR